MLKRIYSLLLPILVSFIVLESFFRILGIPRGGSKFVESVVWRNQLPRKPSSDEFRIFTYGESTLVGAHHAPISSPVRWMDAYLKDFLPQKNIRVINFSRMGRGAAFTLQTFRETLDYHPKIAIFYMGHNDFLPGERVDDNDAIVHARKAFWLEFVYGSRFIAFFYRKVTQMQVARRDARDRDRMGADEIETPAHELNMGAAIPHHTPLYDQNIDFFKKNLEAILSLAARHQVKVILFKPTANLKDFEPLKSGHLTSLSAEQLQEWESHFEAGEKWFKQSDWQAARLEYEKAYRLDPTYALLPYRLGRIALDQGDLLLARRYFVEARDQDWMPCRANDDILRILEETAKHFKVPLLDAEKVILPEAPGGIPGEPVIEDNVHFSIPGQSRIGRALADLLADLGWIEPRTSWHFEAGRTYENIAKDLGINRELSVKSLIQVCSYLGNRFPDRIRTAERAVQLDPESLPALRNLAWTYLIAGEKSKASDIYKNLQAKDPNLVENLAKTYPEIETLLTGFRNTPA